MRGRTSLFLSCLLVGGSAIAVQAQVQGTGTPGQIAVWTDTSTLGDSMITQSPDNKIGIGTTAPLQMLHVSGDDARLRLESSRPDEWTVTEYATDGREWHTGVGGSMVPNDVQGKYYILDSTAGEFRMVIDTNGNVGIGTTMPSSGQGSKLYVAAGTAANFAITAQNDSGVALHAESARGFAGIFNGLTFASRLEVGLLGSGGMTPLCWHDTSFAVSTCSSSLRYKEQVASWTSGLDLLRRLRPVTFRWKDGGAQDLGLIAEEVSAVEPLLVTHNATGGEIEGVKYDRLTVVLINALKEQQTQIDRLQRLLCADHPQSEVCQ